jgi:AcrR family transcriptional regulator
MGCRTVYHDLVTTSRDLATHSPEDAPTQPAAAPAPSSTGIPWWPERRPAREDAALTEEQIATAALAILDARGLDGLSMRNLAKELGVGTMSLYWYVSNKQQLLAEVVDRVMAAVDLPNPDGDWVDELRRVAESAHRTLRDHPEVTKILLDGVLAGPSLLRLEEALLALLRRAGFGPRDASNALVVFTNTVIGFAAAPDPETLGRGRGAPDDRWTAGRGTGALDADRFPTIVELTEALVAQAGDGRFEFAIETTLAGLRAALDRARVAVGADGGGAGGAASPER